MLDGQLVAIFGRVFGSIYLPATLHKRTMAYDGDGNPTATATDYLCKAQMDSVTENMRSAAGYTENDVSIYILAHNLPVSVSSDDEITLKGRRWSLQGPNQDPAGAYWLCRGQLA